MTISIKGKTSFLIDLSTKKIRLSCDYQRSFTWYIKRQKIRGSLSSTKSSVCQYEFFPVFNFYFILKFYILSIWCLQWCIKLVVSSGSLYKTDCLKKSEVRIRRLKTQLRMARNRGSEGRRFPTTTTVTTQIGLEGSGLTVNRGSKTVSRGSKTVSRGSE